MASAVPMLAFIGRALGRSVGLYHPQFGHDIDRRATRYLGQLNNSAPSLRLAIALENVKHEADMWLEEAALTPNGLALQVRLFELADGFETARAIVDEMLTKAPIVHFWSAILSDANDKNARSIIIQIDKVLTVDFDLGNAVEHAGDMPPDLGEPLRGHLLRVDKVGYGRIKGYITFKNNLPETADTEWRSADQAIIRIQ